MGGPGSGGARPNAGGARPGAGRPKKRVTAVASAAKDAPVGAVPVVVPGPMRHFDGATFTGYIDSGMYLRDGCVVFRIVAGHDQADEALKMRLVEGNPIPLTVSIQPLAAFTQARERAREAIDA